MARLGTESRCLEGTLDLAAVFHNAFSFTLDGLNAAAVAGYIASRVSPLSHAYGWIAALLRARSNRVVPDGALFFGSALGRKPPGVLAFAFHGLSHWAGNHPT